MQYMGGKFRIAKRIVAHFGGWKVWEPFAGGANVSCHLPAGSVCSDVDPALATLYAHAGAFGTGWIPDLGEADYAALRAANDPANPLTAVAKYGCSFAGKAWGGFARTTSRKVPFTSAVRSSLAPLEGRGLHFGTGDFLEADPRPLPLGFVLYCDPPYASTTGYRSGPFDHARFVARLSGWAALMPVFVSEYRALSPSWHLVEEFPKAVHGLQIRNAAQAGHTEKLFRVLR